jgi:hypothetical protein
MPIFLYWNKAVIETKYRDISLRTENIKKLTTTAKRSSMSCYTQMPLIFDWYDWEKPYYLRWDSCSC